MQRRDAIGLVRSAADGGEGSGRGGGGTVAGRRALLPARATSLWRLPLWVFASLAGSAHGLVFDGELPLAKNFAEFVGRFCYDYGIDMLHPVGHLNVKVTKIGGGSASHVRGKLYFLLFDDEQKHWKTAWRLWKSSSCREKLAQASLVNEVNLVGSPATYESKIHVSEHIKPRFWYITFVGCNLEDNGPVGFSNNYGASSLRYSVHATNTRWGTWSEFSFDRMRLNLIYRIFAVAFLVAVLGAAWATRPSSGGPLPPRHNGVAIELPPLREHPYIKLLLLSSIASLVSCVVYLFHFELVMQSGVGSRRFRFLAVLSGVVADCTMLLVALLASRGWAITRRALSHKRLFFGAVAAVGGVAALCELNAETATDETTELYAFQSGPGVGLLLMKVFMFCWFAFQVKIALEEDAHHQSFYIWLGVSLSAWFASAPVSVILSFKLAPWIRYQVVSTVTLSVRFLAQASLWYLFCGPLSPISAENTFVNCDMQVELDNGYDHTAVGRHNGPY